MFTEFKNSILSRTDSYKFGSHWDMLKKDTTEVYSYLESRGGKFPKTVWCFLNPILKKYLAGVVVTPEAVEQAREFSKFHLGKAEYFNYDGWMYIARELGGKLPIEIKAPKEGLLIGTSNVLITIKNTDPRCAFVVGYIESLIMKVWYPITIATNGFYLKLLLKKYYDETSDETDLSFKMHDFAYRSVTTEEQAEIGGAAHLLNFMGTDNIRGILWVMENYNAGVCGFSVNATEHAVATPYGRGDGEREYVLTLLDKFLDGILSVVADSYDVYGFAKMLSEDPEIKAKILARDGVFVVRPDSGDPVEVNSKLLNILWKGFGGEFNSKGYKVLDKHVRIIQGDGIDLNMTKAILDMMKTNGYSACNLVFGSGSALLNKGFDRDTQKFAFKASFNIINGEEVFVQKDPITSSSKKSKKGRLILHPVLNGNFTTYSSANGEAGFSSYVDTLKVVFLNGEVINGDVEFADIRKILEEYIEIEYPNYLAHFDEYFPELQTA